MLAKQVTELRSRASFYGNFLTMWDLASPLASSAAGTNGGMVCLLTRVHCAIWRSLGGVSCVCLLWLEIARAVSGLV